MKKSIFSKVGAAAMVLTLVTASLVGGTFAKYTSTVEGTAKATVAKWAITMNPNDAEIKENKFEFNLANTNTNADTAVGTIGPESKGEIKMTIDGTDSEVGYAYDITFDTSKLGSVPVVFYEDESMTKPLLADGETEFKLSGSVEKDLVDTAKDVKVYWKWVSTDNLADTTLGTSETSVVGEIGVIMTANQLVKDTPAQ